MKPIPAIPAVLAGAPRPLWSVMVPTYNPDAAYLEQTLRGVLEQAPGPEVMQICIIDDASPRSTDLEGLVERLAPGRVEIQRRTSNGGMAATWNACIEQARGRWVHILHQDDLVLPGFYARLEEAIGARADLGAAYTQHHIVDGEGKLGWLMSQNPAQEPGVVEDWVRYVFVELSFQTPSIVVKREAYERLGGFRTDMRYALDWDMWKRIAAAYPIWFEPKPLAGYRRHDSGASMDFFATGGNMQEVRTSIELAREYLPGERGARAAEAAMRHYASDSVDLALHALVMLHRPDITKAQFREALRFGIGWRVVPLTLQRLAAGCRRWVKARLSGP
jgi:glycosyltransferase involved in cell wall biosynthesis